MAKVISQSEKTEVHICYLCGQEGHGFKEVGNQVIPIGSGTPPVMLHRCMRKGCKPEISKEKFVHTSQGIYRYISGIKSTERYTLLSEKEASLVRPKKRTRYKRVSDPNKPPKKRRTGAIAAIVKLLQAGEHTLEELATFTDAAPATVKIQVSYKLKKQGYDIVKNLRDGLMYFSIKSI